MTTRHRILAAAGRNTLTATAAVLTVAALTAASLPTGSVQHGLPGRDAAPAESAVESPEAGPVIVVEPPEFAAVQAPGEVATYAMTVGNPGDAELTWEAVADSGAAVRLPVHPVTPVEPVAQTPGGADFSDFPGHRGRPGWTVTPDGPDIPPDQVTLTHSESQSLVAGGSLACSRNRGGQTTASGYLRHFTPADYGVVGAFDVTEVTFGVESRRGTATTVAVNLYTVVDLAGQLRYDNLDLLGSAEASVGNQAMSLVSVPVAATVPATSTLVVEVAVGEQTGGFFFGVHPAGQTAPSYLRAEACGLPEPAPTTQLGEPGMQLLLNVTGAAEFVGCELPEGLPWLAMDPSAGAVAAGDDQAISLTLDAADLVHGETRTTTLCLASNDPQRPRVEVPVSLRAQALPAIEVSPEALTLTQRAGEHSHHPLTIGSAGDAELSWQVVAVDGCDTRAGVDWLAAEPAAGDTAPGEQSEVTAVVDTTGLTDGDHSAELCVDSNDPEQPLVAVPVTVTVFGPACDRTITGVHPRPLTVTDGVTCLAPEAQVQGEVNVLDGAGLVATSAVIQGPVATFGATVVEITDGMIVGPVSIRGTLDRVTFAGNQVVGSMLVVNNAPATGPAVISGNLVVGSLFCTGNQPPPVDAGHPNNVVGGLKLDQCGSL